MSDWSVGSTPLGELYASGAGWGEVGGPSHRHGWARVEERGRTYAVAEDDCRVRHLLCRGASNTREAFAAFRAWADANPRDGATG